MEALFGVLESSLWMCLQWSRLKSIMKGSKMISKVEDFKDVDPYSLKEIHKIPSSGSTQAFKHFRVLCHLHAMGFIVVLDMRSNFQKYKCNIFTAKNIIDKEIPF